MGFVKMGLSPGLILDHDSEDLFATVNRYLDALDLALDLQTNEKRTHRKTPGAFLSDQKSKKLSSPG
jgi:hypothetical protein